VCSFIQHNVVLDFIPERIHIVLCHATPTGGFWLLVAARFLQF
jgi:hypothetical protein